MTTLIKDITMPLDDMAISLMASTNRPIISHFWAVEYEDGSIIRQFRHRTYEEIPAYVALGKDGSRDNFNDGIFNLDIVSISWIPVTDKMARKIMKYANTPALPMSEEYKTIYLNYGDTPYLMRETAIIYGFGGMSLHITKKYMIGKNVGTPSEELHFIEIDTNIKKESFGG